MPNSPILFGPSNTAQNLQANLSQSGRFVGAGVALPWTTAIAYSVGDTVMRGNNIYVCLTAHTSSATFDIDYFAGYWVNNSQTPVNRNYLAYNGNFEDNTANGWNACKSGTMSNGFPTAVGTGGNAFSSSNGGTTTSNLSIPAAIGTSPILGKYSLNMATTTSGTAAGEMYITSAFTVESEDIAKTLTFKFAYKLNGDTNSVTNFSGTSSNTFGVAIYDLANNAWIQPAGVFNFVQKTGVGICTGTFQTPSNATKLQLAIYCATSSGASSISLYLDDFYLGPQTFSMGPAMSDWQSYTPTITSSSGTLTNYTATGNYRRVGDSLEGYFQIRWTGAAGTWDTPYVSIPSGLTIDTTKFPGTNDTASMTIGQAGSLRSAVSNQQLFVRYQSTTTVALLTTGAAGTYIGSDKGITNTVPVSWGSGDVIWGWFKVPITGWSSNSVMSSDTATNVVAASAGTAAAAVTVNSGVYANLDFPAADFDTNGAITRASGTISATTGNWSGNNWKYTAPVSGYYQVTSNIFFKPSSSVSGYNWIIAIYKNGSVWFTQTLNSPDASGTNSFPFLYIDRVMQLNAGDYIDIRGAQNLSNTSTITAGYFNIVRLSGPAVVTATDTVACAYNSAAGNNITNAATNYIDFGTKEFDLTNSVVGAGSGNNTTATSTWRFVCPVSGTYQVNASISVASIPGLTSVDTFPLIFVSGTEKQRGTRYNFTTNAGGANLIVIMSGLVRVVAGDYISIGMYQSTGATRAMDTTASSNRVSIVRVGN